MLLDNQMGFWKMQKCKKRHYACDEYYERGRRRRRELYWRIFVAVSNGTYSIGHQQWMRRRQDCKSEFVGVIHALKIKFKKKYVNCVFSRVFLASLWHFVWTICRAKLEHHSLSNLSNSSLRDAKKKKYEWFVKVRGKHLPTLLCGNYCHKVYILFSGLNLLYTPHMFIK
jgi:hypothetical protein